MRLGSIVLLMILLFTSCRDSSQPLPLKHPIKNPPAFTDHVKCDNCVMDRNMYARTRYVFESSKGKFYTCSLACLVILSMKLQLKPHSIKVADYLNPNKMIDVQKAVYVIGSRARGTMTKVSKIAFSDRAVAERFVAKYGGRIATFAEAMQKAREEILETLSEK